MTHGRVYIPALDGLRAVAVVAVVASHSWAQALPGGWIGVDVFFVLSGYLITSILLGEHERTGKISFRRFYARRALRLFPALAVTLLLGVGIAYLVYPASASDTVHEAIAAALYVANWVVAFGQVRSGLLIHTWTLAIEEQFYWTWPLALAILLRLGGRQLALRVTLGLIAVIVLHRLTGVPGAYFRTDTRADTLLVGCAVAIAGSMELFDRVPAACIRVAGAVGAVAMAAVAVAGGQTSSLMQTVGFTLVALAAACIVVMVAVRPLPLPVRALSHPVLEWAGRRSYGIYLYHPLCLALLAPRLGVDGPATLLASLTLALATAAVSYRYLETPFLRLKDSLGVRRARSGSIVPAITA